MSIGNTILNTSPKKDPSGPPFVSTSAENGASVAANGRIVLGNNVGGTAATLLSNREIPMSGFNVLFNGGVTARVQINAGNVIATQSNAIAFRTIHGVSGMVGDFATDLNGLGAVIFCGSTSRGVFVWNDSNPLRGNVWIGTFPASTTQNNGAALQVNGCTTTGKFVSPRAATPVTVSATNDRGKVFTNEGAGAAIQFNLPGAVVDAFNTGNSYTFYVQNANGIIIKAPAGDTVRAGAIVSPVAGTISSVTVGSSITLQAINAGEWVATSVVGGWVTP